MADLSRSDLNRLALLGAKARLEELRQEEALIRRAFPSLFGGARGKGATGAANDQPASRRRRGRMSAAGRKAVSERMKKYWAERRKAKAAKAK